MSKEKKALVLSGGGSRGAYQVGAWRALDELGIRFDMVVGVSVGALNGAMVVQKEQVEAEHLWRHLETNDIFDVSSDAKLEDFAAEMIKQGGAGSHGLQHVVADYLDEKTLRESDIDFGLLTIELPILKSHYLWKADIPAGKLGDYVIASASAFPMVQSYTIDGKEFIDGGYDNVMPVHMAVEHGATSVVAIYLKAAGRFDKKELTVCDDITLIQPNYDLGNFLLFDKANTDRMLRLGYMDTMKAFDVFDGGYLTFVKGDFDKRTVKQADAAGKAFGLDPLILYRREVFMDALADAVTNSDRELKKIQKNVDILTSDISLLFKQPGRFKAADILKQANPTNAALLLAREIASGRADVLLKAGYTPKPLREIISAARFLAKQGLV